MNIEQWAEKFAASIYEWVESVQANFFHSNLDEAYRQQAEEEANEEL
jgi:hypothetical protein